MNSIISIKDLNLSEIEKILKVAERFYDVAVKKEMLDIMKGKILAALFYEPSTRTRLSFETAMLRLGGRVITVTGMESSSLSKGETLEDTAKVIENFADVVAIRHSEPGSSAKFASASSIPVVNAGDGYGEHPSQALLDLFTIKKEHGKIDGLKIALVGDLKFGRTVHSLCYLFSNFKVKLILVSPDKLKMPNQVINFLKEKNVQFMETENLEDALKECDVLYMTRIQQERFSSKEEYEKFKGCYILNKAMCKRDFTIMHPLPRVGEITTDVDALPGAAYFRQVQNGVAVRMAILTFLLGRV